MKHNYLLFIALFVLLSLVGVLTRQMHNTDLLVYNSLAEKLTGNQIKDYIELQDKWKWVGFSIVPIYCVSN